MQKASTEHHLKLVVGKLKRLHHPLDITRLEAARKPSNSLFGCTVRKQIRHYPALGPLLKCVIANLAGSVDGFFNIAFLENFLLRLSMVSPYTGQVVGL